MSQLSGFNQHQEEGYEVQVHAGDGSGTAMSSRS